MSVGTLFTLFVLPCVYSLLAKPDPQPTGRLATEH
jgi:multidrug efflux pump